MIEFLVCLFVSTMLLLSFLHYLVTLSTIINRKFVTNVNIFEQVHVFNACTMYYCYAGVLQRDISEHSGDTHQLISTQVACTASTHAYLQWSVIVHSIIHSHTF